MGNTSDVTSSKSAKYMLAIVIVHELVATILNAVVDGSESLGQCQEA